MYCAHVDPCSYVWGAVADRKGRKLVIIASCLLLGLSSAAFGFEQRPLCNGCGIPIWSGTHEWYLHVHEEDVSMSCTASQFARLCNCDPSYCISSLSVCLSVCLLVCLSLCLSYSLSPAVSPYLPSLDCLPVHLSV